MTPEIVEGRFGAAAADAKAAQKAHLDGLAAESKALLDKLLRKSVGERFRALEESGDKLVLGDRRKLARSLRNEAPPRREIAATTATWFEIWRARLPYRAFPIAVLGLSFVVAVVLAATAYRHTPQEWVSISASQIIRVSMRSPDGEALSLDVSPGDRFALVRIESGQGVLRYWVDGEGYAEFQLPVDYLRKAS